MSFDADEEILQDFLVEAGELIEQLSEQLVGLEARKDDVDLLNAIFRSFHTVKGGAGFLQLDSLVELCHVAESVFDFLRNGKISVSPELMDVVLQALDAVNAMFKSVHERQYPKPASPKLIENLNALLSSPAKAAQAPKKESPDSVIASEKKEKPASVEKQKTETDAKKDFSDQDFESLLAALDSELDSKKTGKETQTKSAIIDDDDSIELFSASPSPSAAGSSGAKAAATSSSLEDEFENLLDQIHGKGKGPVSGNSGGDNSDSDKSGLKKIIGSSKEDISDDEFEMLLDELHGKGKPIQKSANAEKTQASAPEKASNNTGAADDNVSKMLQDFDNIVANVEQKKNEVAEETKSIRPVISRDDDEGSKPSMGARHQAGADKDSTAQETTVRVDTKRLDDIMNMVGELVLVRNRLVRLGLKSADESMAKAVANLDVVTADLQTAVMKTRMQPIKKVFGRFPRVVRDLARNLKKEINLELQGEETDLDKNLVEALADPLVHLVRNAVDHGIELPDVRERTGKSRVGKVVLAAQQEGDHIVLSITDDGAGMDPDMLRRKAVEKGVMDQEIADRLSATEAFNLIFHPGFSTKDQISDISGRGVGMDVVKTKITQLNGTIDVSSIKGGGTVIAIKVPLTLAIMPTLMVMLGRQTFALPLVSVNEIFHIDLTKTNVVDNQEVVIVRERALPLFHLKRWLVREEWNTPQKKTGHVVVVSVGTQKVGFVVDQLIGQEEVVIKPLGKMLHGTAGMAGATITGDGRIALILDVPSMLKRYAGRG